MGPRYAWETNAGANPGPSCKNCMQYYGCLNRDCCSELASLLDETYLLQVFTLTLTSLVVAAAASSAFWLSNKVTNQPSGSPTR